MADIDFESAETKPNSFAGTYTGIWQSNKGPSGIALTIVSTEGDKVEGKLSILGSPLGYKGDDLVGTVTKFSDGIWTVSLKGKNSRMSATAVFKDGNLLGDYTFKYLLFGRDRGQWVLQRENR